MNIEELSPIMVSVIAFVVIWELIWKSMALWRAARLNQPAWFVVLLLLNTAGILPIIFLFTHKDSAKSE